MFKDCEIILKYDFPDEKIDDKKIISVIAALAYKGIAATKDPLVEFINTMLYQWTARESVITQFSSLEDCIRELIVESMLTRIACTPYSNLGEVDENLAWKLQRR
jgi:hypothetical protein